MTPFFKANKAIIIIFLFILLFTGGCVNSNDTKSPLQQVIDSTNEFLLKHAGKADESDLKPIYAALSKKQYDAAIKKCEKLREKHPDDNNIYLLEGYAYGRKGNYSSSIDRFSHIIDSDKTRGDAYYFRAESYQASRKAKKGLDDLSKALENKETPAQLVKLHKGIGYQNYTVETSKRLIYEVKFMAHRQLKEIKLALDSLDKAIMHEPTYSPLYGFKGGIYLGLQKDDLAYKEFEKVIEINPKDSAAWNMLGLINFFRGDYNRATAQCQKANQLNPENMTFLSNLASSYWLQGSRIKAFETMEKVLKGKPSLTDFYYLAYFHHLTGNQDKALTYFKKSLELNPDILKIRKAWLTRPPASSPTRKFYQDQFKTAKIYIETGKTPKAISHENRAPSLEITSFTLEPDPVPVNQPFDFKVRFKADIPGSENKKIATAFYFKVIQNNKTLFTSKSYPIKVNNGKINNRTQHMNAVPARGEYTIRAFINHKKLQAEKSITLTIK